MMMAMEESEDVGEYHEAPAAAASDCDENNDAGEPDEIIGQSSAAAADATANEEQLQPESDDDDDKDMIDIINETLGGLLSDIQKEVDSLAEMAAKKREEADAADVEADEKVEKMDLLKEQAQSLADDEKWQSMFMRLKVWSKEHGNCNPRRNWKSKIDAEEKSLGNWSGKQRLAHRQGRLNPFKEAALKRLGFAFDTVQQSWDDFHERLKRYLSKHGKLPDKLDGMKDDPDLPMSHVKYYRQQPKRFLGLHKYRTKSGEPFKNERFTQERIDILTAANLDWQLTAENVVALKEKGFNFPMPVDEEEDDIEKGNLPALMKHHWLEMYEALVNFKKKNGHTYVTEYNSSKELHHWVCQQRKKMQELNTRFYSDKMLQKYQAELLISIGFVYSKADVEWFDNYSRLSAYKRLFGVAALVTDKFCSFEHLEQWLEDNKREHLGLPKLTGHESVALPHQRNLKAPNIPLEDRKRLLDAIGVFEVAIGEEEKILRKSHFFFRTVDQIIASKEVVRSRRAKKDEEIKAKGPHLDPEPSATQPPKNDGMEQQPPPKNEGGGGAKSGKLHQSKKRYSCSYKIDGKPAVWIDSRTEREFFLKHGAIISASIDERQSLPSSDHGRKFYPDGRPYSLCRISNCFSPSRGMKCLHFCGRHFTMIEGYSKCEAIKKLNQSKNSTKDDDPEINEDPADVVQGQAVSSCPYCEKDDFQSYDEKAHHEKNCGKVEQTTKILAPDNMPLHPPWSSNIPISDKLTGEAKVLAEDHRYNVLKLALDYRKKSTEQPSDKNDNIFISAALGEEKAAAQDEDFVFPAVKFPSKKDEVESIKLFRRCCGPLAATITGREKLVKDGAGVYGDGRPIHYCRVAGCQMVHSESSSKRFLCDWHHATYKRPLSVEVEELKSKKRARTDEVAYTRSRKATRNYNDAKQAQLKGPKVTVVASAGKLGIEVSNCVDLIGAVISKVHNSSVLVGKVNPGDRIISIDGVDVSDMNAKGVEAIMSGKIMDERRLELLIGSLSPKLQKKQAPAKQRGTQDGLLQTHRKGPRISENNPSASTPAHQMNGPSAAYIHTKWAPTPMWNAMLPFASAAFASAMNPWAATGAPIQNSLVLPGNAAIASAVKPFDATATEMNTQSQNKNSTSSPASANDPPMTQGETSTPAAATAPATSSTKQDLSSDGEVKHNDSSCQNDPHSPSSERPAIESDAKSNDSALAVETPLEPADFDFTSLSDAKK